MLEYRKIVGCAAVMIEPLDNFEQIARLHTTSWRRWYRGIYSDAYLDGALAEDHRKKWRERVARFDKDNELLVGVRKDQRLIGFTYVTLRTDLTRGALVDNLHVDPDHHGQGIGRELMARAAEWAVSKELPMQLEVFAANQAAVDFYMRLRGEKIDEFVETLVDGSRSVTLVFQWRNPGVVLS
jgi:ribosomal protein S18 acetylase RimI-like enzyme